ncbi:hypothetical protein Tco_0296037 [Tanacetum coccineum]
MTGRIGGSVQIRAPLVYEFILKFLSTCRMSDTEMGLDVMNTLVTTRIAGDGRGWVGSAFLGDGSLAPSYVLIQDPMRRLCHRMIAYSISGRGHAKGRKSGARLSGGHFIRRLAMHFGLVNDEGLRGLQVVTREVLLIDLHELGSLNIYARYAKEVTPEIPAPAQAPPPAPQLQIMSQRIERFKEEMHDLRRDVVGLRGVAKSFTTEQSRVSS